MSDAKSFSPSPATVAPSGRRVVDPAAGVRLLDREPPAGYRAEVTAYLAEPPKKAEVITDSATVFRAGAEWLALPSSWIGEVAPARPVHSIPHRHGKALAGLVNVRGELLPCFSLEKLLGIDAGADNAARRLMIAGRGGRRVVFRVDEVFGVLRYNAERRQPSPGHPAMVKHVLDWNGRSLGLLDAEALWAALERSFA